MITQEYECTKILNLDPKIANNQNVKYIFISKTKKNKGKHNNFNTRICRTIFIILFYFMEYVQQIDIGNTHGFVHKRVMANSHKNEVDYNTERDGLAVLM